MTQLAEPKSTHMSNFSRIEKQIAPASAGPRWLEELRRAGIDRFQQVGFPNPKEEHWRHTSLSPITKTSFKLGTADVTPAVADVARRASFGKDALCELVLVNGQVSAELSKLDKLPRGLTVGGLQASLLVK